MTKIFNKITDKLRELLRKVALRVEEEKRRLTGLACNQTCPSSDMCKQT